MFHWLLFFVAIVQSTNLLSMISIKKLVCEHCLKEVSENKYKLERHERGCKFNPNPEKMKCPCCERKFSRLDVLKKHIKRKHPEKYSEYEIKKTKNKKKNKILLEVIKNCAPKNSVVKILPTKSKIIVVPLIIVQRQIIPFYQPPPPPPIPPLPNSEESGKWNNFSISDGLPYSNNLCNDVLFPEIQNLNL